MKVKVAHMFKKLLPLLLMLAACTAAAQTNVLVGNVSSFNFAGRTNLTMELALISPRNRSVGGTLISNDPIDTQCDTNGTFSFTNVCYGYYGLRALDSTSSRWPIMVFIDTTNTVPITSCINWAVAIPPNSWSNYYNIPQINALLAGLGGAFLTNNQTGVVLTGTFTGVHNGNGSGLGNLNGSNLQAGTVDSNSFDSATYSALTTPSSSTNLAAMIGTLPSYTNLPPGTVTNINASQPASSVLTNVAAIPNAAAKVTLAVTNAANNIVYINAFLSGSNS